MAELLKIKGIGSATAQNLAAIGVKTPTDLARARPMDLVQVSGIGPARAMLLIAAAGEVAAVLPDLPPVVETAPAPVMDEAAVTAESGKGAGKKGKSKAADVEKVKAEKAKSKKGAKNKTKPKKDEPKKVRKKKDTVKAAKVKKAKPKAEAVKATKSKKKSKKK
ncbi:helix-hairpin-helix domain-containing protein [Thalassovita taeanensis]|uniref:Helix-hairpin-helix domain-containing protein n=1 Tax=Thalassovita taeanensis TaxID=657014 RepID=A0A1H9KPV6_9RHOB|nr:helix-hairpin-helix domain-containing protein [Thalassovita taeanensis]SER01142.1 Helix-hairpin-helix domain-containing protein [Thalassovita taeanensis]